MLNVMDIYNFLFFLNCREINFNNYTFSAWRRSVYGHGRRGGRKRSGRSEENEKN